MLHLSGAAPAIAVCGARQAKIDRCIGTFAGATIPGAW
jgi:hypothetical protein